MRGGGSAGGGKKGSNLSYIKPQPAFLQRLTQQTAPVEREIKERPVCEDDGPTIVYTEDQQELTADEIKEVIAHEEERDPDEPLLPGKIKFRGKPVVTRKRPLESTSEQGKGDKGDKGGEGEEMDEETRRKKAKKKKKKAEKDKKMLSFQFDDEEEG